MNIRVLSCSVLFTSLCGLHALPQSLEQERNFLVKLRTPIGSSISVQDSPVSASVISPETFLGASLEGVVESVAAETASVRIVFRELRYKGKTIQVSSTATDFVNSKGHPRVDDEERESRVDAGTFVSSKGVFWLDEGAEIKLRVGPRK